jgi:peptidoglycan/LPS O-acetylase OafA/YrhL
MSYPNTAPISGAEKGWGLVLAVISFPLGLLVLIGTLANRGWARWIGLVLGLLAGTVWVVTAIWLIVVFLPGQGASYPFGPWFVFLSGLMAVLCLLAARAFRSGLRTTDAEEELT